MQATGRELDEMTESVKDLMGWQWERVKKMAKQMYCTREKQHLGYHKPWPLSFDSHGKPESHSAFSSEAQCFLFAVGLAVAALEGLEGKRYFRVHTRQQHHQQSPGNWRRHIG